MLSLCERAGRGGVVGFESKVQSYPTPLYIRKRQSQHSYRTRHLQVTHQHTGSLSCHPTSDTTLPQITDQPLSASELEEMAPAEVLQGEVRALLGEATVR